MPDLIASLALASLVAALASPTPVAPAAPVAPGTPLVSSPAPAPTVDSLAYDDPGMHFRAPDGWKRIQLVDGSNDPSAKIPAAVFTYHADRNDARTIVISIEPFSGTLEGLAVSKESELRNATDGTFVDRKSKIALDNGMPAYAIKVSQPSGPAGRQLRRFDYVIYDLSRSIDVAYIGRYGDFEDRDVEAALSTLSVVVYPRARR